MRIIKLKFPSRRNFNQKGMSAGQSVEFYRNFSEMSDIEGGKIGIYFQKK